MEIELDIKKGFDMKKKKFNMEKEFDIGMKLDIEKEIFDFEKEFNIESEPTTISNFPWKIL